MKRYLTYIAEPDVKKKDASLNYYEVDYFNETATTLTLRLCRNRKQSTEFDELVEDLFYFSQMTDKLEIKAFSRDGRYRLITIKYKYR
ncbi:MAG: hypothetical protein ACRC5A_05580 [Enterobacteriaceae bacterium]